MTMARMILNLNGQMLAEYNLSKERYTVGRLPDNDIRIDNPSVSGHHSLIINILNDSFLEDLNSTNGTYVNGKLIKKHALANGDVVTIGQHQLRFVDSSDDSQDEFEKTMVISNSTRRNLNAPVAESRSVFQDDLPAPSALPGNPSRLHVLSGAFAGRELVLKKPLTTLGREGIQVVAIMRRGENYSMVTVERGSRSPPLLNGEAIGGGAHKLNDNDVVEIAGVKMGFYTS
jgi:predicted component of type VI protein secretion system